MMCVVVVLGNYDIGYKLVYVDLMRMCPLRLICFVIDHYSPPFDVSMMRWVMSLLMLFSSGVYVFLLTLFLFSLISCAVLMAMGMSRHLITRLDWECYIQ